MYIRNLDSKVRKKQQLLKEVLYTNIGLNNNTFYGTLIGCKVRPRKFTE